MQNKRHYIRYKSHIEEILEHCYSDLSFNTQILYMKLGVSRSTLHRIVAEVYECKTTDLINDFRLQRSLNLLTETNLLIKEVATGVGFNNTKYYSKIFKAKYAMSPTEYRLKSS